MKRNKIRQLCALALTLCIGTSIFVGCGGSSSTASGEAGQELVFNLGEDPDTIDPTLNTSSGAGNIILNAFEGLMTMNDKNEAVPAIAETMEVSEDGLVYKFKLREDAKWSDGQSVTAKDFEYSWVRALTKETAAEYHGQLFYIKNGEKFYNGEASREELGIKVVDEYNLEVTLESPTTYFPQLLAFSTYMPLREDIVSANPDTWANQPDTYVSNGPFKLVQWDMKDQLVFEKNENYWDKDSVKLDTLVYKLVTDETSSYASLKSGDFDMVNSVPTAEVENGVAEGLIEIFPQLGTYFLCVNVGKNDMMNEDAKKALENNKVRQALALAIDREAIVKNVGKANQVPAFSFVPLNIPTESGKEFSDKEYYDASIANIEEAKKLLEEAGYPNGEGLPTLEFMYNTEGAHKDVAQLIQQDWAKLGVKVELANQEWKVFLNSRQNGEYELARHGWIGDYYDPMTFLDMWVTDGGNNDAGFSSEEYDKLINGAKVETDATKRMDMLREAEDILMDEMPVIPLYYYTQAKGINENVEGVTVSPLGKINFKNAYLEESAE